MTLELIYLHISALSQGKVLIVPYENAGGLAAGVIVHRTLIALGVPSSLIETHLAGKGFDAQISAEILSMEAKKPRYLIVIDQESRAGYPIIDALNTKYLIINHRLYHEFLINLTVTDPFESSGISKLIRSRLSLLTVTHLLRLPPCLRMRSASHCIPP